MIWYNKNILKVRMHVKLLKHLPLQLAEEIFLINRMCVFFNKVINGNEFVFIGFMVLFGSSDQEASCRLPWR